jgi:hypothetical protein
MPWWKAWVIIANTNLMWVGQISCPTTPLIYLIGSGNWTQGLVLTRQAFYCWIHGPSLLAFDFFFFSDRVLSFCSSFGLEPQSFYLCLMSSWVYRCAPSHPVPLITLGSRQDWFLGKAARASSHCRRWEVGWVLFFCALHPEPISSREMGKDTQGS